MYRLNNDEPYSFGGERISQKIFNETPAINRNMVRIVEGSTVRGSLLDKRETFIDKAGVSERTDSTEPSNARSLTPAKRPTTVHEGFGCKKSSIGSSVGSFIDSVMTAVIVTIFVIFLGYMIWISCFEDWRSPPEQSLNVERPE